MGLLAVASFAGLLFGPRGLYAADPATLPAFLGQDIFTFAVLLPLLALALRSVAKGSQRGPLILGGALFYTAYSYAYYVLDPRVNVLFPLYAAIVATASFALVAQLFHLDLRGAWAAPPAARSSRRFHRLVAAYLVVMGASFIVMWTAMLIARVRVGAQPTIVEHAVWALDFMFALPALLVAGVLLWRRRPWGYALAAVMLCKATFLGFTLMFTTLLATRYGVRVDLGQTAMFTILGVIGLAMWIGFLRTLKQAAPAR